MSIIVGFLLFLALTGLVCLGILLIVVQRHLDRQIAENEDLEKKLAKAQAEVLRLSRWKCVADADEKAAELLRRAQDELDRAEAEAKIEIRDAEQRAYELLESSNQEASGITSEARQQAKAMKEEAQGLLDSATVKASQIIEAANTRAVQIAGTAYDAVRNAALYENTAKAMKNVIDGYGDRYLVPSHSLLDELAEDFGHTEAGRELKRARAHVKVMIDNGTAAQCDYADSTRKEMAERFLLDAFNGKVESILSNVRKDNIGKLRQEIRDAYTLVNYNGQAFRNARITEQFLAARLDELKWAVVTHQLKLVEREEQRRIREQIREEEKARREYERAIKEAAKEEKLLKEAMAKAQQQIAQASEEQRLEYEAQLQELTQRLQTAEERNQRAISMAQQTRRGHVYIISNVGTFGEHVYKIGLTRRLDPMDRVKELGDASVPFPFDVHAVIYSEDAPALEKQLHKHFIMAQVNKVNFRKEFFRVDLCQIREEIEELGVEAKWTMAAEAAEYRESLAIEKAIQDDPAACEAWMNRQLTLDPLEEVEESEEVAVGAEE